MFYLHMGQGFLPFLNKENKNDSLTSLSHTKQANCHTYNMNKRHHNSLISQTVISNKDSIS